jgi:hypothetical protein
MVTARSDCGIRACEYPREQRAAAVQARADRADGTVDYPGHDRVLHLLKVAQNDHLSVQRWECIHRCSHGCDGSLGSAGRDRAAFRTIRVEPQAIGR